MRTMLAPAFAMAALTAAVWIAMVRARVGQMKRERIHPQRVATSAQAAALLTDSRAADNFRNLFELPVLFYVASFVAQQGGFDDAATRVLAWSFVAARVVHSAIHVTYNRVMHRFVAYLASAVLLWLLWLLWVRLAIGLFA